jgi:hypothetical protein
MATTFLSRQKSVAMATDLPSNGCYGNHIFVSGTNPLPWQQTTLATVAMATTFLSRQKSVAMATDLPSNGCYGNHIFVSGTNPLPWQQTTLATVAMATKFLSPAQIRCHGNRPP